MKIQFISILITIFFIRINLYSQSSLWTEQTLINHWSENGIDEIEGIYEEINNPEGMKWGPPFKYAILKSSSSSYELIGLVSRGGKITEINCQLQATFHNTQSNGSYKAKWVNCGYSSGIRNIFITKVGITIKDFDNPNREFDWEFEKLTINIPKPNNATTGTGFAISTTGIIVTNYHVIEKATTINIRGINGDFNSTYQAKVLMSDKINDLVLLQIIDTNFIPLDSIPYNIKNDLSLVGENIFVLGYPLLATMGEEIKLTNGIISSKTGFQGDITTYQISAPAQPGNSGGPLFNSNGEIIGIVSAKHLLTENVTYAIKSNLLNNLIQLIPNPPQYTTNILLSKMTLSQQVEILKKFVYIIETE